MDDYTKEIYTDGGNWSESEILGDAAIVKVKASDKTLTIIQSAKEFFRIPIHVGLDEKLSNVTSDDRTAILTKLNGLGYSMDEIEEVLGKDLSEFNDKKLNELLTFTASRRLKPLRIVNGITEFTSEIVAPKPIESIDKEVA